MSTFLSHSRCWIASNALSVIGLVLAQTSYIPDDSGDSENIIIKYCKQYADSAAKGIDVIQDLIGAGLIPNSYYGRTCQ